MHRRNFILTVALFTAISAWVNSALAADLIVLDETSNSITLNSAISTLEDPGKLLRIEDLLKPEYQSKFTSTAGKAAFGLTRSSHWFRVPIANKNSPENDWIISVDTATAQRIDFFWYSSGKLIYEKSGSLAPANQRKISSYYAAFPLTLKAGETGTLYYHIESNNPLVAKSSIFKRGLFFERERTLETIIEGYVGFVLALLLLNIFIAASIRDIGFALLSIAIAAAVVPIIGNAGFFEKLGFVGFATFLPKFQILAAIAGIIAATYAINSKTMVPKFHRAILAISALFGIVLVIELLGFDYLGGTIIGPFMALTPFLLLTAAYISMKKGYRPARFFAISWISILIAFVIWPAAINGLIPYNIFTGNAPLLGSTLSLFFLSVSFADRYNTIQHDLISTIRHANETLEERVAARTEQIAKMNQSLREEITERKKAEQTIIEQQAKMVNSSKMAALGEMAGGIAHEINTPLATIVLNTEILRRTLISADTPLESIASRALTTVLKTSDRIGAIVQGLREFARDGEQAPFLDTSLDALIDSVFLLCQERFKNSKIKLSHTVMASGLSIECRSVQLQQVLVNLINNAFDAAAESPEKWVRVETVDTDEDIEIAVIDSGSGIPEPLQNRIFQPFFTTKKIGKGTGLGLSVSKGIIDSHQGTIVFDPSAPHTRFVIRLPKKQTSQKT